MSPTSSAAAAAELALAVMEPKSLNLYHHDMDLSVKEDEKCYNIVITVKTAYQKNDLTSKNFKKIVSKVKHKMNEYKLNRGGHMLASITNNGVNTAKLIKECYGEISLEELHKQVEVVWLSVK